MTKKQKAKLITERVISMYPDAVCSLDYEEPYQLLIAGRLSAQCTDARVNMITKTLFSKYRSIEDFANSDISELEQIVRPCGLYRTKAKSIKEMCIQLLVNFNGELPDNLEDLTTLSGIGRKTANLIMGDIYKKPAIVTDTHCIRITNRLGLTKSTNPAKVEADLKKLIPPEDSARFCHCMVYHGRSICKARSFSCENCGLNDLCSTFVR